ncbi:GntR family transcriptional regulator [Chryseobacterium sp. CBSDS_008]|uniref:GntR family transcriptional regulator n=1 Tax=Chryseobacterium sp. CBSDS_008 TaxID=3415265 RepID=UPI003CF34B8C
MRFREQIPIYLQIVDIVCEKIILYQWLPQQRIPSIRDFAIELMVNPNTIKRTYEFLEQKEIIFIQRGIGFSVSEDGYEKVLIYKKESFLKNDLAYFFSHLYLLNLNLQDLEDDFNKFIKENFSK